MILTRSSLPARRFWCSGRARCSTAPSQRRSRLRGMEAADPCHHEGWADEAPEGSWSSGRGLRGAAQLASSLAFRVAHVRNGARACTFARRRFRQF